MHEALKKFTVQFYADWFGYEDDDLDEWVKIFPEDDDLDNWI